MWLTPKPKDCSKLADNNDNPLSLSIYTHRELVRPFYLPPLIQPTDHRTKRKSTKECSFSGSPPSNRTAVIGKLWYYTFLFRFQRAHKPKSFLELMTAASRTAAGSNIQKSKLLCSHDPPGGRPNPFRHDTPGAIPKPDQPDRTGRSPRKKGWRDVSETCFRLIS